METKKENNKKRRFEELDCDTEEKALQPQEKRRKTNVNVNTENINQPLEETSAMIKEWKCEWCGKLEDSMAKGTYVLEEVDGFVVSDYNVCKRCHDSCYGLRPMLDSDGNVEPFRMMINCHTCMYSGKPCPLYPRERPLQWQKVAIKYHKKLTNDSTTEEWQAAFRSMFGEFKHEILHNVGYNKILKSNKKMHFGKHEGKYLHKIPISYVLWMKRNDVEGVTTKSNEFAEEMRRVWSDVFQ
eukprot:7164_1